VASKLELIFATDQHGKFKLTVYDPRPDLTAEEVESAMNTIIEKNIFSSSAGNPTEILSARVVSTETVDIISA